jgi:FKBP-type peptidyl-prolyl cis-trans isomerase FkpA
MKLLKPITQTMNHKLICLLAFIPFVFSSCFKDQCGYLDQQYVASSSEIAYMDNFFTTNSITGLTQHSSGVYYKITSEGTGSSPNLCSNMLVNYSAYRFGYGNPFDSYLEPQGIPFILGQLIVGVQKVMPLVKAGGSITMYIPPSLAYGSEAQKDQLGNIILPANSYIRFDMALKAVQ